MMRLEHVSKKFLKGAAEIFESYGNANITYDALGNLFSEYFQDTMYKKWKEDPEGFIKLTSIDCDPLSTIDFAIWVKENNKDPNSEEDQAEFLALQYQCEDNKEESYYNAKI